MSDWLTALPDDTTPSVLVTVALVEGSGPREAGAKMRVHNEGQLDTIGGGHLELRAVEIAKTMLATGARARLAAGHGLLRPPARTPGGPPRRSTGPGWDPAQSVATAVGFP